MYKGADLKNIDTKLFNLVGFRTPTEGYKNIDAIEVAGFLPKEVGNMVVVPSEIVVKSGSDYDVDKLTLFIPNSIKVGREYKYIPTNDKGLKKLYDEWVDYYNNLLTNVQREIEETGERYSIENDPELTLAMAVFGDDTLLKNPDLLETDKEVSAKVTAWYFKRSKDSLAQRMGFGSGPLSMKDAALLTTSQVAGHDVRNSSDYVRNELLGKVENYSSGIGQEVLQGIGGGFFKGPNTGYPVTLHGNELVIPDFKIADFQKAISSSTKTDLPDMSMGSSTGVSDPLSDMMARLTDMMESKMNDLISAIEDGNDTSDKILQYSRV